VLDAVSSPLTKRQHGIALELPSTINQAFSWLRRSGSEAADAGMLNPNVASAFGRGQVDRKLSLSFKPLAATGA